MSCTYNYTVVGNYKLIPRIYLTSTWSAPLKLRNVVLLVCQWNETTGLLNGVNLMMNLKQLARQMGRWCWVSGKDRDMHVTVNCTVDSVRRSLRVVTVTESDVCVVVAEQNVSAMLDDTGRQQRRYIVLTFWDSQVAVVGIGLCTGVIVASLSFVCYQRLTLRRLRAKQDTQTPAYRALVASKQKQADVKQANCETVVTGRLQPRSPRTTTACLSSRTHRAAAVKLSTSSPVKQRALTPSSARRRHDSQTTPSPVISTRTAAQLSIFQPRTPPSCHHSPAMRSSRARSKSPREAFECVCLVAGSGGMVDENSFVLETRPPVEGRDSLSVEHVLDTAATEPSSAELKTANYVPPTECSVAVRRSIEPTQVTRGTSPMSISDVDVLPDISGLLTSGTETDDVDDVMTMTGAPSSSSLSDLVASCDAEFDSDDCAQRPPSTSLSASHQRHYKVAWTRKSPWKQQRDAMLEPDVYYC